MKMYWWQNNPQANPTPPSNSSVNEDCQEELKRVRKNFQDYHQKIQDIIKEK